jgi:hypothetical protein
MFANLNHKVADDLVPPPIEDFLTPTKAECLNWLFDMLLEALRFQSVNKMDVNNLGTSNHDSILKTRSYQFAHFFIFHIN